MFSPPPRASKVRSNEVLPWFFVQALISCFFIISFFFLFTIQFPRNAPDPLVEWNFRYLTAPIAVIVLTATYRFRSFLYRQGSPARVWFAALGLVVLTPVFVFPYELAMNASGGSNAPKYLHGPIIQKYIEHGRQTDYVLTVSEETQHQVMTFSVSQDVFDGLRIGQIYGKWMFIGQFGIPYRWAWEKM